MLSRVTDEELDGLSSLVDEMERAARAGDIKGMNEADIKFHTRVIRLSGHELLLTIWESYVQRIRRALTLRNMANKDLTWIIPLHRELVDAFRHRDMARVQECYEDHGADVSATLSHLFAEETVNGV
jgi:DNA-binding GntR family transcriptional regulator